mmetsp:Transcript_52509/g.166990  ORF Transcript_52509/g.166990 Transcript_52509/m.166990 type:complete len:240 (-) Transcript_52509:117-836(-)
MALLYIALEGRKARTNKCGVSAASGEIVKQRVHYTLTRPGAFAKENALLQSHEDDGTLVNRCFVSSPRRHLKTWTEDDLRGELISKLRTTCELGTWTSPRSLTNISANSRVRLTLRTTSTAEVVDMGEVRWRLAQLIGLRNDYRRVLKSQGDMADIFWMPEDWGREGVCTAPEMDGVTCGKAARMGPGWGAPKSLRTGRISGPSTTRCAMLVTIITRAMGLRPTVGMMVFLGGARNVAR